MPLVRVEKVFNLVPVSQGVIADPCKILCTRPPTALWIHGWVSCPYCGEKAVVESHRYELHMAGVPGEMGEDMKKGIIEALTPTPEPVKTETPVLPEKAVPEPEKKELPKQTSQASPKKAALPDPTSPAASQISAPAKDIDEGIPHYSFETMPKEAPKKPKGGKHER